VPEGYWGKQWSKNGFLGGWEEKAYSVVTSGRLYGKEWRKRNGEGEEGRGGDREGKQKHNTGEEA